MLTKINFFLLCHENCGRRQQLYNIVKAVFRDTNTTKLVLDILVPDIRYYAAYTSVQELFVVSCIITKCIRIILLG